MTLKAATRYCGYTMRARARPVERVG